MDLARRTGGWALRIVILCSLALLSTCEGASASQRKGEGPFSLRDLSAGDVSMPVSKAPTKRELTERLLHNEEKIAALENQDQHIKAALMDGNDLLAESLGGGTLRRESMMTDVRLMMRSPLGPAGAHRMTNKRKGDGTRRKANMRLRRRSQATEATPRWMKVRVAHTCQHNSVTIFTLPLLLSMLLHIAGTCRTGCKLGCSLGRDR